MVVAPRGIALADADGARALPAAGPEEAAALLADLDTARAPRWVWWSAATLAGPLLRARPSLRLRRCWDLAAVHRLLVGGSADDPARVWAAAHGLPEATIPPPGQLDLAGLSAAGERGQAGGPAHGPGDGVDRGPDQGTDDAASPVRADGHLRPEWVEGAWADTPSGAVAWAGAALEVARRQEQRLLADVGPGAVQTAWSESAAALLAVELGVEGLPVDLEGACAALEPVVGPRPRDAAEAEQQRAARDAPVLRHLRSSAGGASVDLRSPGQVREALAGLGLDVPDTRSWRLEQMAGAHPVVPALLAWRQAERLSVAHGYRWLDEHVVQGRLRAVWSASDGGAGRMTASDGVHSLPRELRPAVRAEPGHLLVRADLGQVEPRVLAAVSGDAALARAALEDDLYSPVAARLGVGRDVAKVAVLAAMYGQTSGAAGATLQAMERSYPVAIGYLVQAYDRGVAGEDVRTAGGRRVRVPAVEPVPVEAGPAALDRHRQVLAGRGRFARNAVVQGAAAELFKAWAATVRARLSAAGSGVVVLCLHDELLLHVRDDVAEQVACDVVTDLEAAAARWCRAVGARPVRFVADVAVVERWSQAKA